MAKLNAPLFSFSASGAIAESLVYGTWRGLNVVRQYVVPTNPKTGAQTTQRGYLKQGVEKVHAVQAQAANPLDTDDLAAYAMLGSLEATPRTWFNTILKLWLDTRRAAKIPVIYSNATISDKSRASFDMIMYLNEMTASQLAAGKFYFGRSKSAMINTKAATVVAGTSVALTASDCSAFLTAGFKYFVQFKPDAGDPCIGANSGIMFFTAVA